MALFSVNRFLGDEDEDDKQSQAKKLLKKLNKDAQLRRLSEGGGTNFDNQKYTSPSKDSLATPKLKSDSKESLKSEGQTVGHSEHTSQNREQRKRKRHKLSSQFDKSFPDENSDFKKISNRCDSDEHLDKSVKRKRKARHSDLGRDEIGDDREVTSFREDSSMLLDNLNVDGVEGGDPGKTETEEHTNAGTGSTRDNEIGGFTVIGRFEHKKPDKVKRILPDWLANPSVITSEVGGQHKPIDEMPGLDSALVERMRENNITHFFPVQIQVIPALLDSLQQGFLTGKAGYRPSDICVSAPTGSGKTLAFVLPIIQGLRQRVCCKIRALVVLPVRDLAAQIYRVFQNYCTGTSLKVGLLVGQKAFHTEQQMLVRHRLRGFQSLVDIIVATPGRLVDHINQTPGFDLSNLRFLVIDEADRIMDEVKQEWLSCVEAAVYKTKDNDLDSTDSARTLNQPLTVNSMNRLELPLQKLLFSATLSQNPEKLQQLNLFQPKLFTSVVETANVGRVSDLNLTPIPPETRTGEFVGKYTTPKELTENFVACTAAEKPLIILYFLKDLKFRHVLCFTNSVESTHRLYHLIKLVGGVEVREFSSGLHAVKRNKILQKFAAGKVDIIICSDAMARGMDIDNVKYVISYDTPSYIKTYIHRIGRTARAGKIGTALTLLQKKEFYHFKKMVREAGKTNIKELKVPKTTKKQFVPLLEEALTELPDILKDEKLQGQR